MKKFSLTLIISLFFSTLAMTQDLAYDKGDHLFNAGFGLGYYNYGFGFGRSFSIPAVEANFEIGIHEYIGIGPYAGFVSWNYTNPNFRGDFAIVTFGGRASFHYTTLLEELLETDLSSDVLDLYVTMILGAEFENYSGDFESNYDDQTSVFLGPVVGARYYISKSFGVYAEGGRGSFSFLKLGLSLKL